MEELINAIIDVCEEYIDRDTQCYLIEKMIKNKMIEKEFLHKHIDSAIASGGSDGFLEACWWFEDLLEK